MRALSFLAGIGGIAALCWLFYLVTYPIARWIGVFRKDKR